MKSMPAQLQIGRQVRPYSATVGTGTRTDRPASRSYSKALTFHAAREQRSSANELAMSFVVVGAMPTHRTPPWKKPRPKQTARTKLTPASIAKARAAAKKAGRRYPNLVDNMAALRAQVASEAKSKGSDRPR